MNEREILILTRKNGDNEFIDSTKNISECTFLNGSYRMTFQSGKEYPWKTTNLIIEQIRQIVATKDKCVFVDNILTGNTVEVIFFETYAKIFFINGGTNLVKSNLLKISENLLTKKEIKSTFSYLKAMAQYIENKDIRDNIIRQYQKINTLTDDNILACYLKGELPKNLDAKSMIIYPFGCNKSQIKAIEDSICNPIAIIEGPPGTGKTNTILNILES